MQQSEILALRDTLLRAADFEDVANTLLTALLDKVEDGLYEAGIGARVIGAFLHLRPRGGAYRTLVSVLRDGASGADIAPSTTVWSVVERHQSAVSVDVTAGVAEVDSELLPLVRARDEDGTVFASQHDLIERQVTHILALPLRQRRESVDGMVALEIEVSRLPAPFTWAAWGDIEAYQVALDLATPTLCSLPLRTATTDGPVQPDALLPVIGTSMRHEIELLALFSGQDETVLLAGPTGSGKSKLARWCHSRSARREGPFESVDLLTVPDEMQMAELFGWCKGAFTGAHRDQIGLVERAERGTLFIDEIDKLSMKAQAGLLRFLEERHFRRLGDSATMRQSDLRIIVGTNVDLLDEVQAGRFRSDLFYRINVLPVRLRPLRERKDEIAAWATVMADRRHSEASGTGSVEVTREAAQTLAAFEWPGNLRQLDNVIRRAYAIAASQVLERSAGAVQIMLEDIERAMTFERGDSPGGSLLDALRTAAWAFVTEARARGALSIDHADAFRGLVLAAGLELTAGNREETVAMLGKEHLLAGRNHHKFIKRELSRMSKLYGELGDPEPEVPGFE